MHNQQIIHKQDESPLIPAEHAPESEKQMEYEAIKVKVVGAVATTTGDDQYGMYSTIVIPPSSATAVSYVQILARDKLRQYAYLQPIDEPIVITTAFEMVQSLNNVVAAVPVPSGAYVPALAMTPAIRHNDPVWAANTSTSTATRVVVYIERGREP
jgi:hypothetical protein